MLFAEISDGVWLALIAAVITPIINMIVQIIMNKQMASNIQKIETATNSMKDALVDKTEKEARLRGGVEERARSDKAVIDARAAENLAEVKEDVKEVKSDIKDVKTEILQDKKLGI